MLELKRESKARKFELLLANGKKRARILDILLKCKRTNIVFSCGAAVILFQANINRILFRRSLENQWDFQKKKKAIS